LASGDSVWLVAGHARKISESSVYKNVIWLIDLIFLGSTPRSVTSQLSIWHICRLWCECDGKHFWNILHKLVECLADLWLPVRSWKGLLNDAMKAKSIGIWLFVFEICW
jgi:hypothetical protein